MRHQGRDLRPDHRQYRDTSTTTPGSEVSYTITVTDTGQTPYTGATVTDALPACWMTPPTTATPPPPPASLIVASPNLTWTGNLAAGASATITFSVTVNNPDTGDKVLASTITSADAGQQLPGRQPRPRLRQQPSRSCPRP